MMIAKLKKIKKIYKKASKGVEALTFAICMVFILQIIVYVVGIAQISTTKEQLQNICYNAGRTAVVCDSKDRAENAAKKIVKNAFGSLSNRNNVKIEILRDSSNSNPSWEKGNYIRCTVTHYVNVVIPTFSNSDKTMSTYLDMMIENDTESLTN